MIDYFVQRNIGTVKYLLSYYKGKQHKDGSKFYDIATFKNKNDMKKFIQELKYG